MHVASPEARALAGLSLEEGLYMVFELNNGRIVHIRDHLRRGGALAEAGVQEHAASRSAAIVRAVGSNRGATRFDHVEAHGGA